jgi:hypothetical protein
MTNTNKTFISRNIDKLNDLLNADFLTITVEEKMHTIQMLFSHLDELNDVDGTVANEKLFFDAFTLVKNHLDKFLEDSKIDINFYK